jgi:hypothetical protein
VIKQAGHRLKQSVRRREICLEETEQVHLVRDQEQEEEWVEVVAGAEWAVIAPALDLLANVYVQAVEQKFPIRLEFLAIL